MGHLVYCLGGTHLATIGTYTLECRFTDRIFALNLKTMRWIQVLHTVPHRFQRAHHHALLMEDKLLVLGGKDSISTSDPITSCWKFDLVLKEVEEVEYKGESPLRQVDNCMEYVEKNGEVVAFGGQPDVALSTNIVHALRLSSREWRVPKVTGVAPRPRSGHSSCIVGTTVFIWGGIDDSDREILNDLNLLEVKRDPFRWSRPRLTGPEPKPRYRSSLHFVNGRLFIFGGNARSGGGNNGSSRTLDVVEWRERRYYRLGSSADELPVYGQAPKKSLHASVAYPTGILIVGGSHDTCSTVHCIVPYQR